jgi:hypothetical protein
MRLVRGADQLK